MKFAILSDIHANLEALQAVLADAKEQRCTHYAFLGDFVGYCADPKACIDIVRALNAPCVKGNHDEYCATDLPLYGLNANAAKAVHWTRKQLAEDEREWLKNLPYARQVADFTIVHSTLDRPEQWHYIFDEHAAATSFPHQTTQLCFFGHTHVPVAFVRDTVVRGGSFTRIKVEPGKKYFVNPGSVGQPRDRILKAAYVVYDMNEGTVELRRISYDIAATQKKIRDAGLSAS
jgi:predicted phosphodiesterase